jgi:hypothetical protein
LLLTCFLTGDEVVDVVVVVVVIVVDSVVTGVVVVEVLGVAVELIGVWLEESVEMEVIVGVNSGRGVVAEDSLE